MRLDLRRLSYFKAIVEAGSISAAARRLTVPQPALSYHLKELEAEFGGPLLVRSRNGSTPTEGGQLLFAHATTILAQVARASEDMQRLRRRGPADPQALRIAAAPTLAVALVPLLLKRAAEHRPASRLYASEVGSATARDMLRSGDIDLAILIADDGTPPDRRLTFERLLLVMADSHPDRSTAPITLREALAEPLLLPSRGKPGRDLVEALAKARHQEVRVLHEIDGAGLRKQAVSAGLARSFLPWISIRDEVAAGRMRFRDVIDPPMERYIALECRDGIDPAIAETFTSILRDILAPIVNHPARAGASGLPSAANPVSDH